MLSHANPTQGFWAKALYTTVYLINHSPDALLNFKVPKELCSGHKVPYDRLGTFDCEAYTHVLKELCAKLDFKSRKCIFIGYGSDGQFGYHLWDPKDIYVICSSDVVFNETKMHSQPVKKVEF